LCFIFAYTERGKSQSVFGYFCNDQGLLKNSGVFSHCMLASRCNCMISRCEYCYAGVVNDDDDDEPGVNLPAGVIL